MDPNQKRALEQAEEVIQREHEIEKLYSKQPRFSKKDLSKQISEIIGNYQFWMSLEPPEYKTHSRARDLWLSQFWKNETHLAGVLNGAVAIDKNRGWSLTGGRNQVIRFERVLHNWVAAPGLVGWRPGISAMAIAFYSTDLGGLAELGTQGRNGPLRGLYHLDPTHCLLTENFDYPVAYYPKRGKKIEMRYQDYIRVVSMPAIEEDFYGLGYCAISRCIEMTQLMLAIYQHDKEMLNAAAPRGLLLLPGLTRQQWDDAMLARQEEKEAEGWRYFDTVAVIAGGDTLDAKLVSLSQLPENFDLETFTSTLMFAYSLSFGYDPSEFWPVQFGALGRGTETQVQHDKATAKGGLDFILGFQEQLQDVLPESLDFEFDNRDDSADLLQAQIFEAWGRAINQLRETQAGQVDPAISWQEARALLADHNLIPREWADVIDNAHASDTEDAEIDDELENGGLVEPEVPEEAVEERHLREWLLSKPSIWRAIDEFPKEPIVRYRWPTHRVSVLWEQADDLLRRRSFVAPRLVHRLGSDTLYYNRQTGVKITEETVQKAIDNTKPEALFQLLQGG